MIELTVDGTADPEAVRTVLIDIARDNDAILSLPSPQVRFINLTASAMTFDLYCFVADVESMVRTKSDLYLARSLDMIFFQKSYSFFFRYFF